jgi:hypothetical protein
MLSWPIASANADLIEPHAFGGMHERDPVGIEADTNSPAGYRHQRDCFLGALYRQPGAHSTRDACRSEGTQRQGKGDRSLQPVDLGLSMLAEVVLNKGRNFEAEQLLRESVSFGRVA